MIDDANQGVDHVGIEAFRRMYLYGALTDICGPLGDFEARAIYKAEFEQAHAEIIADIKRRQYQGSRIMRVRRY